MESYKLHMAYCVLSPEKNRSLQRLRQNLNHSLGRLLSPSMLTSIASQTGRFLLIWRFATNYPRTEAGRFCNFFLGRERATLVPRTPKNDAFADWSTLKTQLEETFGPLHTEDSRLDLFSLTQTGSLDEYIREFSHLSLKITE